MVKEEIATAVCEQTDDDRELSNDATISIVFDKPGEIHAPDIKRLPEMRQLSSKTIKLTQQLFQENDEADRKLRSLITLAKKRGHVTYQELLEVIPSDKQDDEETLAQLEHAFGFLGIPVLEKAPAEDEILLVDSPLTLVQDDEEDEDDVLSLVESDVARTSDPMSMYTREMGTVPLLTREDEVAISREIEQGYQDMMDAIAHCPVAMASIM